MLLRNISSCVKLTQFEWIMELTDLFLNFLKIFDKNVEIVFLNN